MIHNKIFTIIIVIGQILWSSYIHADSDRQLVIVVNDEHKLAFTSEELYQHLVVPFISALESKGISSTATSKSNNLVTLRLLPVSASSNIKMDATLLDNTSKCKKAGITMETRQFDPAELPQLAKQSKQLADKLIKAEKTNHCKKIEAVRVATDLITMMDDARSLRNKGQLLSSYMMLQHARVSNEKPDSTEYILLAEEIDYLHPAYELDYKLTTELQSQPERNVIVWLFAMNERLARSMMAKPMITPERMKTVRLKLDEMLLGKLQMAAAARAALVPYLQQTLYRDIGDNYRMNGKYPNAMYIMTLLSRGYEKFTLTDYSANKDTLALKLRHTELGYGYIITANKAKLSLDFDGDIELSK